MAALLCVAWYTSRMIIGEEAEDPGRLVYQIEMHVQAITLAPGDVELHKELRRLGLRYKAAGGKAAGMFTRVRATSTERKPRQTGDLVERLGRIERLWAMDPGNVDYPLWMLPILKEMEQVGGYGEVGEVLRWVKAVLDKMTGA